LRVADAYHVAESSWGQTDTHTDRYSWPQYLLRLYTEARR